MSEAAPAPEPEPLAAAQCAMKPQQVSSPPPKTGAWIGRSGGSEDGAVIPESLDVNNEGRARLMVRDDFAPRLR